MKKKAGLRVPKVYEMTFRRMMHRVPRELRDDEDVQQKVLLFLKLGGERLARQKIKLLALEFPEDLTIVKLPARVECIADNDNTDKDGDDDKDDTASADDDATDDQTEETDDDDSAAESESDPEADDDAGGATAEPPKTETK